MDEPTTDETEPAASNDMRPPLPTGLVVVGGVVALIAALLLGFAGNDDEERDVLSKVPTFPPTTATTTTAAPAVVPSEVTTAPGPTFDPTSALWPEAASDRRFTTPEDATRSFAVDLVGFTEPQVSVLGTSGTAATVGLTSRPDGPSTTVSLTLDPATGTWWVTGAATPNILVNDPLPGSVVSSPVALRGSAVAFEGTVDVQVRADAAAAPAGAGFVTGGGTALAPFDGQVEFTPGSATAGSIVFRTLSAEDGSVEQATVVRVRFGA